MTAQTQALAVPPPMAYPSNSQILDDCDLDTLIALDRLDDQEQSGDQDFFCLLNHLRTTEPLHSCEAKEIILDITLPKCLETQRERALYGALMIIIRAERAQRISSQQQLYNQSRELQILRQAVQAIVAKAPDTE